MSYITYQTMQKLLSVGFTFPDYEHFLNLGMVYYHKGNEYFIGGSCGSGYSEQDKYIAHNGCWLPCEDHLLEWLTRVEFDVSIRRDSVTRYFCVQAIDTLTRDEYHAGGVTLANALAKIIYKICKASIREFVPYSVDRLEIE